MTTFQTRSLAQIVSALAAIALTTTAAIACEPYCVGGSHSTVESPAPMDNSSGAPSSTYENAAPEDYSSGAPNSTYENVAPEDDGQGVFGGQSTLESPQPGDQQNAAGAGDWYDPNAPLEAPPAYDPYANADAPMIAPAP